MLVKLTWLKSTSRRGSQQARKEGEPTHPFEAAGLSSRVFSYHQRFDSGDDHVEECGLGRFKLLEAGELPLLLCRV